MSFVVSPPAAAKLLPEYVEVAVSLPIDHTFTYRIPEGLRNSVRLGHRLLVPFGRRKLTAHVLGLPKREELDQRLSAEQMASLKEAIQLLDPEPMLPAHFLKFLHWVSAYYHASIGEVLKTATPTGIDLKSIRQVALTELGQSHYDPKHIDSAKDHALQYLFDQGITPIAHLQKLPGVTEGVLRSLEKKGWLTIDHALERVRVQIRRERFIRLAKDPETENLLRGKKQKAVWLRLKENPETPLAALEAAFPGCRPIVKRLTDLGLIALEEREIYRDPFAADAVPAEALVLHELNAEQRSALAAIEKGLESKAFNTFLLHGVTGSGKTEVYVRAVSAALAAGREAIVLVPEIALTAQLVALFRRHFGEKIALIHSHLNDGERYDQWRRILRGELKIAIGARSALFAPFSNLGLVVVDEEHEGSFKQEKGLLYHARDLAVARASFANAVAVLGSATPSVESFHNATEKKFSLLQMPSRIANRPLPNIELIDLKNEPMVYRSRAGAQPIFSVRLIDAIKECLEKKEQVILLLNRRGYSPHLICLACGKPRQCQHCAISLTYYQKAGILKCHYCDHSEPFVTTCPACKSEEVHLQGFGTEGVEEELQFHFPQARLARMDRDTTTKKGSHQRLILKVEKGEIDILLGTQMIAKGLHFPNVTLVGVISADVALNMPDFRAGERTFQLLTQVAGRAGRGDRLGHVLIQTFNPEHYAIVCARAHDYSGFVAAELQTRREVGYPPFSRLVSIRFKGPNEKNGKQLCQRLKDRCAVILKAHAHLQDNVRVLGPAPAPISRVRGDFRWHLLLKAASPKLLHEFTQALKDFLKNDPLMRGFRYQIDVDPVNLL